MPLFRKCLLIMNAFAFTVGLLIYIKYFPTLVFFRLCQGFCVGFFSAIAPLMVKELSPNEISGTLGSYAQLNICLGVFTGCILAYILKKITGDNTGEQSWYIIFGFTELTIAIQTAILIFVYPYETPKYLLSIGKEE
jgi:MFS family permease